MVNIKVAVAIQAIIPVTKTQHAPAIHVRTMAAPSFNLANARLSAASGYQIRALVAALTQPVVPTARAGEEFINVRRRLLRHVFVARLMIPINHNA